MLASHGRYPCAPCKSRPDFLWPDGKRLAVYVAVNVEHFPYGEPGGIDLDRPTLPWSQRSWLWRDYGNRVGGWKLLDLFEELWMSPQCQSVQIALRVSAKIAIFNAS